MHTHKENKIIQLCMATLFLAILMVYILLFQVKGSNIYAKQTTSTGAIQISTPQSGLLEIIYGKDQKNNFTNPSGSIQILEEIDANASKSPPINTGSNMLVLSGTDVFYGTIDIIEKLGIKYQYALIDSKGIYYINLGNPLYDFGSIARGLGGNIYELKTEVEIAQNKLFGEKIVFMNLPEYKEKKVIIFLYIQDQVRLIQLDYAIYHKTKSHLKSLFIQ